MTLHYDNLFAIQGIQPQTFTTDHYKFDTLDSQTAREYVKDQHRQIADDIREVMIDFGDWLYNEFERRLPPALRSR